MKSNPSMIWLVAEDSEDDFFLLNRACSRLNPAPTLRRARNGIEAQQYLAGDKPFHNRVEHPLPSVVVSDLHMPLMNGLDLLAWFKDQLWEKDIPFVLLTSSDDQTDRKRASASGADGYMVKPGRFADLVETVTSISERVRDRAPSLFGNSTAAGGSTAGGGSPLVRLCLPQKLSWASAAQWSFLSPGASCC